MWTGIVRDLDPIQISLPAVQILAKSISSVHVGNIITLVLEEALLGNNDDDSTVKPIQQDISNCVIVAKFKTYKYELWRTMFQLPSLVW